MHQLPVPIHLKAYKNLQDITWYHWATRGYQEGYWVHCPGNQHSIRKTQEQYYTNVSWSTRTQQEHFHFQTPDEKTGWYNIQHCYFTVTNTKNSYWHVQLDDASKIDAIVKMTPPRDVKEFQSCLGILELQGWTLCREPVYVQRWSCGHSKNSTARVHQMNTLTGHYYHTEQPPSVLHTRHLLKCYMVDDCAPTYFHQDLHPTTT